VGLPSEISDSPNQLVRGIVLSSALPDLMLVGGIAGVYERAGGGAWIERRARVDQCLGRRVRPRSVRAAHLLRAIALPIRGREEHDAGRSWKVLPTALPLLGRRLRARPAHAGPNSSRGRTTSCSSCRTAASSWQDSTNDLFVDDRETLDRLAIAPSGRRRCTPSGPSASPRARRRRPVAADRADAAGKRPVNGQLVVDPATQTSSTAGPRRASEDDGRRQSWRRLEGGIPNYTWIASIVIDPTNRSTLTPARAWAATCIPRPS
jgi:hypothetical protein